MTTEDQEADIRNTTAILRATVEKDDAELHRLCGAMPRADRLALTVRLMQIRKVLDDLNAVRCMHCHKKIAKVPPNQVRGGSPGATYWFHLDSHTGACAGGTAEPAPLED